MRSGVSNLTVSDEAYMQSVETIEWLQMRFLPYEWWIVQTSVYGDNREAFLVFFPFVAGLMNILGARALWAAILSEWLNLLLKWIFKGDRPYWWVHQSSHYTDLSRPILRQFANTCESGPGTPSGHLMINVAFFYVLARGLSKYFIWNSKRYRITKMILTFIVYSTYILWIAIVTVSRLYIQAHFIHQCFLGIVIGLLIGQIAWSSKWLIKPHNIGSAVFSTCLTGSAVLTYLLLLKKGLDPLWAVPLAMKYCTKAEYVSIDTQPYFIMIRFSSASIGLGFSLASKARRLTQSVPKSLLRTILSVKAGLVVGRIISLAQKNLPTEDLALYLSSSFALQMIFPYVIVAVIPYLILRIWPPKRGCHC